MQVRSFEGQDKILHVRKFGFDFTEILFYVTS